MRDHRRFISQTKMPIYFAHPHSPWERGTNENTNGLLWQCFPAGTHFNKVSRGEIKRVQTMLNDRPRNILNWHSLAPAVHHLLRSDLECTLFPHRSGDRTMDRRQPRRHSIPFPSLPTDRQTQLAAYLDGGRTAARLQPAPPSSAQAYSRVSEFMQTLDDPGFMRHRVSITSPTD